MICFEILPKDLDIKNDQHLKLAGFFGALPTQVNPIMFTLGYKSSVIRKDGCLLGRVNVDCSNGLGKFQALKEEQDRLDKLAEEERLRKEAEAKRLAAEREALRKKTREEYFSAPDIVSLSFSNVCHHQGSIRIVTASEFTNQGTRIDGQRRSSTFQCRPGDKVYDSKGKLLHTVAASSNGKVVEFCPPKTQAMLDEEDFQNRHKRISIDLINRCDHKIYYNVESGASTSKTWMGGHSQTSVYMSKGDKIWVADENGRNVQVIYEPQSYTQNGQDVYLCR